MPGLHRRHVPAQGLRLLRGALERARACCSRSRASTSRVPLFLVEGIKRRARQPLASRKVAVLGLAFKARHRRRARLALAQADPPARARAGRRRRPRPARRHADAVARGGGARRRRRRSWPPTTPSSRTPATLRAIARAAPPTTACVVDPWNCLGRRPGVRVRRRAAALLGARRASTPAGRAMMPRPRHRRRRHDRRGRRAPPAARPGATRCASPTSARRRTWMREGCEVHTGDLRDARRRRARRSRGCSHVIHLAAIVGGIANFHKLPHTLTEVNNALYNARLPRRARRRTSSASSTCPPRWCSSARREFPTTEDAPAATARRRARPTASRSSPARSTAAPRTTSTACRYTICRPFNAYGPGEMPDATSRASPTRSPT